ncbi:CGNR zinc finger domain-containing protein [Streptomyces sp. BK340]|uniref:CGNR zinc finger domain-containing protein n=1 Tax=Streptomyces sp. BK340 TaxID=2572903 RepID=UPI001C944FAF|nr:CGNR zinc finger domain-containing protein [Streptomyces sp. BK340]
MCFRGCLAGRTVRDDQCPARRRYRKGLSDHARRVAAASALHAGRPGRAEPSAGRDRGRAGHLRLEAEGRRLGVCALDSCRTAFADTSRNGRRAYCSARCANTDAVRRHRTQQG